VPHGWNARLDQLTARVSSDGSHVVFMSAASMTGYDNRDAVTGARDEEVFLYGAEGTGSLVCVSCDPSGERPTGASSIPGGTPYESNAAMYQSRVLSAEGSRVFFDSSDGLVPADSNGERDVYEWEREGVGSCRVSSGVNGGCVYLLSGGEENTEAQFVDASASGSDVFFITGASLVSSDPGLVDLYDAREGASVPQGVSSPACTGSGCQGVPSAQPIFATPSSATFAGVGNFPPTSVHGAKPKQKKKPVKCKRGFVKNKKSKCIRKKAKKAKRAGNSGRARS
jgi:hypothetical protein